MTRSVPLQYWNSRRNDFPSIPPLSELKVNRPVVMKSQALNFLWLNLDLPAPPDPPEGIYAPLPLQYIKNVREAGRRHASSEVILWVDSQRLTEKQMAYLKQEIEDSLPNVHLKDLRTIPAYRNERLYNKAEKNPHWRDDYQNSLIWRQVDAAKILVCLQGNHERTFFADLDHAHLNIDSHEAQRMLTWHGLLVGSDSSDRNDLFVENQVLAFTPRRRKFFEEYYEAALKVAYKKKNPWEELVHRVENQLLSWEKIPLEDICLPIDDDGSEAKQPGHKWSKGDKSKTAPLVIPFGPLTPVFNSESRPPQNGAGLSGPWRQAVLSKLPPIFKSSPASGLHKQGRDKLAP